MRRNRWRGGYSTDEADQESHVTSVTNGGGGGWLQSRIRRGHGDGGAGGTVNLRELVKAGKGGGATPSNDEGGE